MSEYICLLISVLYNDSLLKVALKIDKNILIDDAYMEDDNKKILYELLPMNCKYPIVEVVEIFEFKDCINTKENK